MPVEAVGTRGGQVLAQGGGVRLTTSAVVGVLRRAGLESHDRSTGRPGFAVRKFGGGTEVALLGDTMDAASWGTAMRALESAGLVATYRCDEGLGSRWRRAVAA